MSAKFRFKFGDINRAHSSSIANMTNLVTSARPVANNKSYHPEAHGFCGPKDLCNSPVRCARPQLESPTPFPTQQMRSAVREKVPPHFHSPKRK
jgi:hypothetical protein